jgi:hypothetical protein
MPLLVFLQPEMTHCGDLYLCSDDSDSERSSEEVDADNNECDEAPYDCDRRTLRMLVEASNIVKDIARGVIGTSAAISKTAEKLHNKWALLTHASDGAAEPPQNSPVFRNAADSLLVFIVFLRDIASNDLAQTSPTLPPPTMAIIQRLCNECGFPLRFPLPHHGYAQQVGETAVHADLIAAARANFGDAKGILRRLIFATYAFYDYYRDGKLADLAHSTVVGGRAYILLNGSKYESFVSGTKLSRAAKAVKELREATIAAQTFVLHTLMGRDTSVLPNTDALSILIGASLDQLEHFDVCNIFQLLMILSAGMTVRAVPTVDAVAGLTFDEVIRKIETLTEDHVRRAVGQADDVVVSRFDARQYVGVAYELLRTSPQALGGVLDSEPPEYEHTSERVGACGATDLLSPMALHKGPKHPPSDSGWPSDVTDHAAIRKATAALYYDIDDFEDVIRLIMDETRDSLPRIVAFTTVPPSSKRPRFLARVLSANSTQNRPDAILIRLGLYLYLVKFYLLARERGHDYMPSFCTGGRQAAGRALLALTSRDDARKVLAGTPSLAEILERLPPGAAAVAAAFPAAMSGKPAETEHVRSGLAIINAVLAKQQKGGSDAECVAAAVTAAKQIYGGE